MKAEMKKDLESARHHVGEARDNLAGDFRSLAEHAEALLKATTSASGEGLDRLRDELKSSLNTARERFEQAEAYGIERGKAALQATEQMVRDRPWQVLAVATLVGVVVGCLAAAGRGRH